jgi:hypothetical protein
MKFGWLCAALGAILFAGPASADEGMWTFDNFPFARMKQAYGFAPDQAWLDRVRLASVRLSIGCSAGLISDAGLVQTNHHCVVECVTSLSEPGRDLNELGFLASSNSEERKCPALSAEIVTAISDVTARIREATAGKTGGDFTAARDAEVSRIESACQGDSQTKRCEVVSFYQGGQYKLHEYHSYNDVRLVFAPEAAAANFGGDPDNFNFPRYAFDVSFVRLYDGGEPVATPHHLHWRSTPLKEGEPVFMSGNPGSTSRGDTLAEISYARDLFFPWQMTVLSELRGRLLRFMQENPDHARIAADVLYETENTLKAHIGTRAALVDPGVAAALAANEEDVRARVANDPELAEEAGPAWQDAAEAMRAFRALYLARSYAESRAADGSLLFAYARMLVRAAEEKAKPSGERLEEYNDASLPDIEQELFAEPPVEPKLEELLLAFWLSKTREYLTVDDPLVRKILGRESPEELAHRLVEGTRLADVNERRRLYQGGASALAASDDPMILFARRFDAEARALRKRFDSEVEGPLSLAHEKIARARFKLFGDTVYPDANFTLRLTYGRVEGWTEPSDRVVEPFTRFVGLYERTTGAEPYRLAPRWKKEQGALNPDTIFNVSTTNDIVGGNSGSPMIDRDGQVVGVVFDGNIQSLAGDYIFDARYNRAVALAAPAIEEALVKVYGLQWIIDEIKR